MHHPMRSRAAAALLIVVTAVWGAAAAAVEPSDESAKTFISRLAEDAIRELTDETVPRDVRIRNFRVLFNERFAVGPIARFVLGRSWRRASTEQKREFVSLFEDLMVVSYVDKFARYSGEPLKIDRAIQEEEGENRFIVYTSLVRPGSSDKKPVEILWRLGFREGAFKVLDVLIEGASMGLTYRKEFESIIRNEGIDGLLVQLRIKTEQLNAQAEAQ